MSESPPTNDLRSGNAAPARSRGGLANLVRSLVRLSAVAYLLALLAIVAAFRLIGERWWVTTIALYLPRIGWALPLPLLVLALLLTRSWWYLLTQLAAAAVVVFVLMGLHLSGPRAATAGAFHLRVFTLNIGLGENGIDGVLARVRSTNADVIVLEAVAPGNVAALRAGLSDYSVRFVDQFAVASRFPFGEVFAPRPFTVDGEWHTPHYARFQLRTPAGPLRLFATHPISPHDAFSRMRGEGLRYEALSGRLLETAQGYSTVANTAERVAQIQLEAEDAARSPDPVLIAGDTNLPGLSRTLAQCLGDYQDAFAEAGRGFGYTYPAQRSVWMRIDRILADQHFTVLAASVVSPRAYDHLGVMADLEMRPQANYPKAD